MSKQKYPVSRNSNYGCFRINIITIFMVLVLLIRGNDISALLISAEGPTTSTATPISATSSSSPPTSEENSILTDKQGIKLKEIRKLARLAGHEQPEIITEVNSKVCYKDDCLKAAKEFFISMDFSREPCLDWLKYSCEWRTLSSKTSSDHHTALSLKVETQVKGDDVFSTNATQIQSKYIDILLDPDLEKYTVKMAQSYYKACNAWFNDINKIDHIRSYLETLGNWPLLSGKTGGEGEWSKILAEILRIVPENVTPFLLKLEGRKDDGNDRVLLQVDSGSTYLAMDSDYIRDVLQILRMKPSLSVQVETDGIRELQMSMKMLSAVAFDVAGSEAGKVMSLKDIQDKLTKDVPTSNLNILNLIKSTFQGTDLKIVPEMEIVTDYNSLLEYVKTLNLISPTAVLNILFLQLTLILMGDSTSVIEDNDFPHMENYRRAKSGYPSLHCLRETSEVFSFAISEEYIARHHKTSEARQMATSMVDHLKIGFKEVISSISWLDENAKDVVSGKITETEVLVGFPNWIESDSQFAAYYENLNFIGSNSTAMSYLSFRIASLSWLNGKYWKTKLNDEKLDGNNLLSTSWNYLDGSGFVGETNVEYIPSLNQIRIPAGILQPPLFSVDFPGYMIFAGLGSIVARELSRVFDSNGIYTNGKGEYGKWFSDKSYKSYMDWASRIGNDWDDDEINLNRKVLSVLGYHITVKGYEEYLKNLKRDGKEEIKLPGLSTLEPEKLFHLKFTNILCESPQMKRLRMSSKHGNQCQMFGSDALYPVSRTNHFSKVFGCELDYANSALDII